MYSSPRAVQVDIKDPVWKGEKLIPLSHLAQRINIKTSAGCGGRVAAHGNNYKMFAVVLVT